MKIIAMLLLLGAALGPLQAVGSTNAVQLTQPLQQGVIEQVSEGGKIRVNGASYAYSPTTAVFNRQGVPVKAARLAPGKTIVYTVQQGGSQPTLNQIWVME